MTDPRELAKMDIHRQSHLAATDAEGAFVEFELALHHIIEAFGRWSSELHFKVSGEALPVQDVSVLQVIRMKERPKSAGEIGKFLNRTDSANILYGLRKLEKAGLIEKTAGSPRQTMYQVTARGREVTDSYAKARRDLLLTLIGSLSDSAETLDRTTKALWLLSGFYEQAARTVSVQNCLATGEADVRPFRPAASAKPPSSSGGKPRKPAKGAVRA